MISIKVDFPLPVLPINPILLPLDISKFMPLNTFNPDSVYENSISLSSIFLTNSNLSLLFISTR